MCCEFTVILLLLEQFCSPGTHWHSGFISIQAFSCQAIHVRLIRAQAATLVTNTFFSTCPVLVQSVTSLVINIDHFLPLDLLLLLSLTHIFPLTFLPGQLQYFCSSSCVPTLRMVCFHRASLQLGKCLLGLVRLFQ